MFRDLTSTISLHLHFEQSKKLQYDWSFIVWLVVFMITNDLSISKSPGIDVDVPSEKNVCLKHFFGFIESELNMKVAFAFCSSMGICTKSYWFILT